MAILDETERSIVLSPISTTRPPRMSGFTWLVTFSFLPAPTYADLETAASRRERVLLSNCYRESQHNSKVLDCILTGGNSTWALVTINSTSPRDALMISPNFSQTPGSIPRRLFSARVARKFLTVSLEPAAPRVFSSSAIMPLLSLSDRVGVVRMAASLVSLAKRSLRELRAFAAGSRAEDLAAAVY